MLSLRAERINPAQAKSDIWRSKNRLLSTNQSTERNLPFPLKPALKLGLVQDSPFRAQGGAGANTTRRQKEQSPRPKAKDFVHTSSLRQRQSQGIGESRGGRPRGERGLPPFALLAMDIAVIIYDSIEYSRRSERAAGTAYATRSKSQQQV